MKIALVLNSEDHDTAIFVKTALERRGHTAALPLTESIPTMSPSRQKNALEKFATALEPFDLVLLLNGRMPRDKLTEFTMGCAAIASLRGKTVVCWGDLPAVQSQELSSLGVSALRGDMDLLDTLG